MKFALQFKAHDSKGKVTDELWTRLVVDFEPNTDALEVVAHWKGYDSLLKCADVREDISHICAYMYRAAVTPEFLTPVSVQSNYAYSIKYA